MSPIKMSKIESGLRTVLDFNKACNRHDIPSMMRLISDECVFESSHPAPGGTAYAGKAEITQFWADFFREAPDTQIKIEDISGFGNPCIMRWRLEWTDESGTRQHLRGIDLYQVENSLICEILSYVKGARNIQG